MAVLALAPSGGTIVCNGYKDREFVRLALIGQKLGHKIFIVIERSRSAAGDRRIKRLGLTPMVGLRVRLSALSHGQWADSGGEKASLACRRRRCCR